MEPLERIADALDFIAFCQGISTHTSIGGGLPVDMQKHLGAIGARIGVALVITNLPPAAPITSGALSREELAELSKDES